MTNKTAMLLTGSEWDSLEAVAEHYLGATSWAEDERQRTAYLRAGEKKHLQKVDDRRDLCKRLIEANQ